MLNFNSFFSFFKQVYRSLWDHFHSLDTSLANAHLCLSAGTMKSKSLPGAAALLVFSTWS